MRRATIVAMIAATLAISSIGQAAAATGEGVDYAARYLVSNQKRSGAIPGVSMIGSTAMAVVALQAAGMGKPAIKDAIAYLADHVAAGTYGGITRKEIVGAKAKVVLAVVAAGRDPRAFGGRNLIDDITSSERASGRYGRSAVFNQATAMLALAAAGTNPSTQARDWLVARQCADGGWAYDKGPGANDDDHCQDKTDPGSDWFTSDTNTTSMVVQALEAGTGTAPAVDPFAFFDAARDGSAGWGYAIGFGTDSNSTGLAIQAYAASGVTLPSGASEALTSFQDTCSGFRFSNDVWVTGPDVESTVYGILGSLSAPLPILHAPATGTLPVGCPV